jgi:glyoxylate reductase
VVKLLVPQPIPPRALARLEALCDEVEVFPRLDRRITRPELLRAVADKDVLWGISGVAYDREVIAAAPSLRLIAAMHAGATFVDKAAATERGIPVSGISNDGLSRTTAEFTFALLMATAWRLPEADRFLREGRWAQNQSMAFLGRRLSGKTLGVLGLGDIGRGVAHRARAFGMRVLYTKRTRLPEAEERASGWEYREVPDLFRESDFLAVCVSLTPETRGLVDAGLLALMPPGAILVNTSRGQVVDERALAEALRSGALAGAGLDVFEEEDLDATRPPGPRHGLLDLPNVVLTPHIGSAAVETREEMAGEAVDAIEAFLAGRRPARVFNPEAYDRLPRTPAGRPSSGR